MRQCAADRSEDLVIATIALRYDLSVYTVDPEFDVIADLKRFL